MARPLPTLAVSAGEQERLERRCPETGSKRRWGLQGGGKTQAICWPPPGAEGSPQDSLGLLKEWPVVPPRPPSPQGPSPSAPSLDYPVVASDPGHRSSLLMTSSHRCLQGAPPWLPIILTRGPVYLATKGSALMCPTPTPSSPLPVWSNLGGLALTHRNVAHPVPDHRTY